MIFQIDTTKRIIISKVISFDDVESLIKRYLNNPSDYELQLFSDDNEFIWKTNFLGNIDSIKQFFGGSFSDILPNISLEESTSKIVQQIDTKKESLEEEYSELDSEDVYNVSDYIDIDFPMVTEY